MATTMVAVLAAGSATLTVLRWWRLRVDALGRVRPFPTTSVALLVAVVALAAVPVVLHERLERQLSEVATTVVGHPVTVHCQTTSEAVFDVGHDLGFVPFDAAGRPEPRTILKTAACDGLRDLVASRGTSFTPEQGIGLHVLTHEAMHMAGVADEAHAECAAVQRNARTARLLGVGSDAAWRMSHWYWRTSYPSMPPAYWSAECAPGGALDERLADAPWLESAPLLPPPDEPPPPAHRSVLLLPAPVT